MTAPLSSSTPPSLDGPLLSLLAQSLQDYAILILDRDGCIVSWNIGGTHFKGWHTDDAVGRSHALLYAVADVDAGLPEAELRDAERHGRCEQQCWRVRRDGSRFWANVVITPVRDAAGELTGFGEVVRDVTDHYAAIAALRRSEARFRAVTESATDAILSIDSSGLIVTWNPAAARLYGYTAEQAIGTEVRTLVPAARHEVVSELLALSGQGELPQRTHEGEARRADGTIVPVEVSFGRWEVAGEHAVSATVRDITERRRTETALQHLADHDPLTGLYNRRRFEAELERIASEAERYGRAAALLVLDLDGFKEVNDVHGHSAGDEVIAKVGELLSGIVRESDAVARLGGDEFGIVVQEADADQAQVVAEKIISAMRSRGVVVSDLVLAHVTVSIGITSLDADGPVNADELLVQADGAMYEAKARGRNRWARHRRDGGSIRELRERHSSLARLREALDTDGFELHAQPIVAMHGADIPRYELLLRLRGADGELLVPGAFLDNAERFDLIGNIDRWVLQRAVSLLHAHHAAGRDISLTVNLSGKTMNDASIVDDLRAMMRAHPVPPGRLVVEVTETAAIVNIDRAAALARGLRELGCDFALDDFGSGFASFNYLKHLRFDYLKIDGEFIAGLVQTPADQLVVRAVVDIARGLGSETIAEFVEDAPTLDLLAELGVDHGQGYHLGRPAPLQTRLPDLRAAGGLSA